MSLSLVSALAPALPYSLADNSISNLSRHALFSRPECVRVFAGVDAEEYVLRGTGDRWSSKDIELWLRQDAASLTITLTAPNIAVHRIHIRWKTRLPEQTFVLGDAWERSYGDLAWLPLQADRVLPWYFVAKAGTSYAAMGVKTRARAFAF